MSAGAGGSPHRAFFLAGTLSLGALAALWRRPELAVLGLWFVLALAWSWTRSRRLLDGLTAARTIAPAAFEEDVVPVRLRLENRGRRRVRFLEVQDRFGAALAERQRLPEAGPIAPRAVKTLRYEGACSQLWGSYRVGPLRLIARDALGLYPAARSLPLQAELSLFPQVHEVEGLVTAGGRPTLSAEDAASARAGQSLLFLGLREYQHGDDPRRIHWPATARAGRLMVKEHEVDLVPYLTLFLDLDARHRAGLGRKSTKEYVVRTGASLLATAARRGQVVQLFAESSEPVFVPPGRGAAHLMLALESLIHLRQDGERSLFDLVEDRLAALPAGSSACLLFSTATPDPERLRVVLERLQRRQVRPSVVLVDEASFQQLRGGPGSRGGDPEARARALDALAGVPHALVDAGDDLPRRLREGLFEP